eukprot:288071-Prymnesium_polylepis.2
MTNTRKGSMRKKARTRSAANVDNCRGERAQDEGGRTHKRSRAGLLPEQFRLPVSKQQHREDEPDDAHKRPGFIAKEATLFRAHRLGKVLELEYFEAEDKVAISTREAMHNHVERESRHKIGNEPCLRIVGRNLLVILDIFVATFNAVRGDKSKRLQTRGSRRQSSGTYRM